MSKIKFENITDSLSYPPANESAISVTHNAIISSAISLFKNTYEFKKNVIRAMNIISYCMIKNITINSRWESSNFCEGLENISEDTLKSVLGKTYINMKDIDWSSCYSEFESDEDRSANIDDKAEEKKEYKIDEILANTNPEDIYDEHPKSSPEDLYLNGPRIPRIDTSKVWRSGDVDGTKLCIYYSLPRVPTVQSEISVTTNPDELTDSELLHLYPDCMFYTRPMEVYSVACGMDIHPTYGGVPKIKGFTKKQVIDNIIKYPCIDGLTRVGKKKGQLVFVEFEKFIEVDGELYKTTDMMDKIPEMKSLKKTWPVIREYVVRRYLLERDIKGIEHKYPMFGTLDPFVTLFMPSKIYREEGYKDSVDIARQCVKSRVSYLQSRNPVIRRLEENE